MRVIIEFHEWTQIISMINNTVMNSYCVESIVKNKLNIIKDILVTIMENHAIYHKFYETESFTLGNTRLCAVDRRLWVVCFTGAWQEADAKHDRGLSQDGGKQLHVSANAITKQFQKCLILRKESLLHSLVKHRPEVSVSHRNVHHTPPHRRCDSLWKIENVWSDKTRPVWSDPSPICILFYIESYWVSDLTFSMII